MKFSIKKWIGGSVIFEAEIAASYETQDEMFQMGAAVKIASEKKIDLTGAYLTGAYLTGADLRGADLTGADLTGADLRGAIMDEVTLDSFKQDLIAEILKMPSEIDALREAVINGKINGSTYDGDCACLAGTIQKAAHKPQGKYDIDMEKFKFRANVNTPREQWFLMIKKGDTPETSEASKRALEWIDEAIAIRNNIRLVG